nr:hypothetical protein [Geodermatophilus obscurus]
MGLVQQGEQVRRRPVVGRAHHPLGVDRADAGREGAVRQHGLHVRLGVAAVAGPGARHGGQDAVALEVADLLDRVPGPPGDIDRPQA